MSSTKFWEIFVQFAQKKMLDKILAVWYNVEFGARTAKGSRARADKKKGFRPSNNLLYHRSDYLSTPIYFLRLVNREQRKGISKHDFPFYQE